MASSFGGPPEAGGDEAAQTYKRPGYLTVGSGSTSESARALQNILDEDSGYGGSVSSGQGRFAPGLVADRYTPTDTEADGAQEDNRRLLASHVHQLYYNRNKAALGRAITQTVETLKKLQAMNKKWPAHYPSVQPAEKHTSQRTIAPRPGLQHTQTTSEWHQIPPHRPNRPDQLRRAETSVGEDTTHAEASATAANRPTQEPRLITPSLAQDLSILKLDLKMGSASQAELVHSLEKQSIAALLDGQILKTVRHLHSLRERIEDTASKVLVTGDLNAGKSTFCNALLRRKVLPEDQQPCTGIFCEVLDCGINSGIEEVHAIPTGATYNRNDESTYRAFPLTQLEKIVTDSDNYSQCKVYIKDVRRADESLLNNNVVDITLIDAPGLNADSVKTTAIFARQEEIDVVVFVVSAANHFTQTARDFVLNAAMEKSYIFMVVNGYDNIRDQQRCQELVLRQVQQLSPATFKDSSELVHFVSSNAIPTAGLEINVGASGGGGAGGGGDPDFPDPDDLPDEDNEDNEKDSNPGSSDGKGKGKERAKIRDFEELESSLRRFVLERRARSKLAPAKTYLVNVLNDLQNLASVNCDVAQSELDRVTEELKNLTPQLDASKKATNQAGEEANRQVEDGAQEMYDFTRQTLNEGISHLGSRDLGLSYPGILHAYAYADEIKAAMLQEISDIVSSCEEKARQRTVVGVNAIKSLGLLHVGDDFANFTFREDLMFTRRKDVLTRQVDFSADITDFFDLNGLWDRQEKFAGTSMAVTVAGVVGGRMLGAHWLDSAMAVMKVMGGDNVRRLVVPGIVAAVVLGAAYALGSIPKSLPRRLSAKLSAQLARIDYTHANAARISNEVRRALRYPAGDLRVGLQRSVEKLQSQKEDRDKLMQESEVARKYFGNLLRESAGVRDLVDRVDLEGPAPGVAAGYDF